ncbi:MAG: DNA-3-methyladenine glycosylase [Roseimicrobium sp.]
MLTTSFFQRDVLVVARELIGVELVWRGSSGLIVETEAYAAEGDDACHVATRPSARQFIQETDAGSAYVYLNYGMYWLFNLLVKGGPRDGLILIRALEPEDGIAEMQSRRQKQLLHELCSGPGKLAVALGITGADHATPMVGPKRPADVGLRRNLVSPSDVAEDVRVGISKAVDYPWRFLHPASRHVSVPLGKVKPLKA